MSGVHIARLGPTDIIQMRALNAVFGEAFEDAKTYLGDPPGDGYTGALLAKRDFIALVAVAQDAVVGGLVAYELQKFEQARREIYIYDLAVAEPFRRRGIASELIGTLQQIASASGAYVIFVQANYGDDPAIALYEKLGTREEVLHFDISPNSTSRGSSR